MAALRSQFGEEDKPNASYNPFMMSLGRKSSLQTPDLTKISSQHIPSSHLTRLQESLLKQNVNLEKRQSLSLPKRPSLLAGDNFMPIGNETAQKRIDLKLHYNSKLVQCELLRDSPKRRRKLRFADKQVQVSFSPTKEMQIQKSRSVNQDPRHFALKRRFG